MNYYQIAVIVGSLRKDSFNLKLTNALVKLAPSEFTFKQLEIGDLPLYRHRVAATAVCTRRLYHEQLQCAVLPASGRARI